MATYQAQQALRNFEDYHELPRGTATVEQVQNSSAGMQEWARPSVRALLEEVSRKRIRGEAASEASSSASTTASSSTTESTASTPSSIDSSSESRTITVVKLSGETAHGPEELHQSMKVEELKKLFDRPRPKTLMFGDTILEDSSTLEMLPVNAINILKVYYTEAAELADLLEPMEVGPEEAARQRKIDAVKEEQAIVSHRLRLSVDETEMKNLQGTLAKLEADLHELQAQRVDRQADCLQNAYAVVEKIGAGTYGDVYKAARKAAPEEVVAIKRISVGVDDDGVPATALREIAILKSCQHSNIVRLQDVLSTDRHLYLIFEYLDTDLHIYMKKNGPFTQTSDLQRACQHCFRALHFCHANRIIHRDVKPANILIDLRTMDFKMADFGLARYYSLPTRRYSHEVVTLWYRPPEILLGQKLYSTAVDIWSFACVMIDMVRGRAMFAGDSEIGTLFLIFKSLGTPTECTWPGVNSLPDFKCTFPKWQGSDIGAKIASEAPALTSSGGDLLTACLQYDAAKRPSARKCLAKDFLQSES